MELNGFLYKAQPAGAGRVELELIVDCPVFKGHFPDFPVLPGAAVLEIVRELVSEYLGRNVRFTYLKSVKFMKMIRPSDRPSVEMCLDPPGSSLRVSLFVGEDEYVRINAVYEDAF